MRTALRLTTATSLFAAVFANVPVRAAPTSAMLAAAQAQRAPLIASVTTMVEFESGSGDASHANRAGTAVVPECLGLLGGGYYTKKEYILLESNIPRRYLLSRLLRQAGSATTINLKNKAFP